MCVIFGFQISLMKRIAIVYGGYSPEVVISRKSAQVVFKHIDKSVYEPIMVGIEKGSWYADINGAKIEIDKNDFSYFLDGQKLTFDCAFIAIHGTPGEDGKLEAYFDMIGMRYTTANPLALELTFNKYFCNAFLKQHDIPSAKSILLYKGKEYFDSKIIEELGLPCFVKPNDSGSSFGVTKVKQIGELNTAIEKAFKESNQVIIESFLSGTEVSCGVLELNGKITVLPATEIVSEGEYFDFAAKYEGKSQEITPARISKEEMEAVQGYTKKAFELLNLTGMARIDFMICKGNPFVIEVNTVPGLSEESILPQQCKAVGMSLSDLFNGLIKNSFYNKSFH